jgi:hypothetical protein
VAQQLINVGTFPNDATGDPAQTAFTKCNTNFGQLFGTTAGLVFGPPPVPPGGVAVTISAAVGSAALVVNQSGSIAGASIVGQAGAPVSLRLTDGQAGTTVWSVNVGINTAGEFEIINNTAGTTPIKIAAAGNVTVAAPTSGTALTLPSTASAVTLTGANASLGIGTAFLAGQTELFTASTNPLGLGTTGAAALNLYTNAALGMSMDTSGRVTFVRNVGVNNVTPPAQSTGWGTPTGASISNNFNGAAATLPQATAAIAELILILKAFGLLAA